MDNLDLNFIHRKEKPSSIERDKIPLEISLEIQMKLPQIMARDYFEQVLTEDALFDDERLKEALLNRFVERYVQDYNGLDSYCSDPDAEPLVINRLQSGTYTESDLAQLVAYMQSSAPDRKFFADKDEVEEFINKFLH